MINEPNFVRVGQYYICTSFNELQMSISYLVRVFNIHNSWPETKIISKVSFKNFVILPMTFGAFIDSIQQAAHASIEQ